MAILPGSRAGPNALRVARLLAILGTACLVGAIFLIVRPDPWDRASEAAAADALVLADLADMPDRIGWRLSEDPALQRALLWGPDGLRYPPPGGLVPLAYTIPDERIRDLAALRDAPSGPRWRGFDAAGDALVHCRAAPPLCLIYDRRRLEDRLALAEGALLSGGPIDRTAALLTGLLGVVAVGAGAAMARTSRPARDALVLDPSRHVAQRGELEVLVTPRDMRLLRLLKDRAGDVVSKDELYDAGWGRDYMPNSRSLDQHMLGLRRKLDPDRSRPPVIETVRGIGYRLVR